MKPKSVMLIAGETSGDVLAAELVQTLRQELASANSEPGCNYQPLQASLEPRFFGAGGQSMAAAGVDLAFDMTAHSVIGLSDVLKNFVKFRRLFHRLLKLALERQPDAIVCVDFSGFNRRFAHAVKQRVRRHSDWFHNWNPVLVQYVSPQVWASREGRVYQMAADYDLVLSIFPFEKAWYADRVPNLLVDFVGNPILDRHRPMRQRQPGVKTSTGSGPVVLLLPGSRLDELRRHLPVMIAAFERIQARVQEASARVVLPRETLMQEARRIGLPPGIQLQCGALAEAMRTSTLAIASTGTVTMECACFGLPTIAMYKTSWLTFEIAKRIVRIKFLAMPNILANAPVFPEFIQNEATPEAIAAAAVEILNTPGKIAEIKARLDSIVGSLGEPGASFRAAQAIAKLVNRTVRGLST